MQRGGWVASGRTGFLLRVSSLNRALAHKKEAGECLLYWNQQSPNALRLN